MRSGKVMSAEKLASMIIRQAWDHAPYLKLEDVLHEKIVAAIKEAEERGRKQQLLAVRPPEETVKEWLEIAIFECEIGKEPSVAKNITNAFMGLIAPVEVPERREDYLHESHDPNYDPWDEGIVDGWNKFHDEISARIGKVKKPNV